jgi:peroxiredoxin
MNLFLSIAVLLTAAAGASGQTVAPSPTAVKPLLIGAVAPDADLRDMDGKPVMLKAALGGKPGVVIFYRGGWCPYCNAHLHEVKNIEKDLRALGYVTVAISPDRPEELAKTAAKQSLPYALLSDSKLDAARAFGIAFQVDSETLTKYAHYGVDLRKSSGEPHDWLPVPSLFLIGKDGKVKFAYTNPDYRVRLKAKVLLAEARAALDDPDASKP